MIEFLLKFQIGFQKYNPSIKCTLEKQNKQKKSYKSSAKPQGHKIKGTHSVFSNFRSGGGECRKLIIMVITGLKIN